MPTMSDTTNITDRALFHEHTTDSVIKALLLLGLPAHVYDENMTFKSYRHKLNNKMDTNLLSVPSVRTCFGSRSFSVAAPTIWNSLSFDIRNSCSFH